MANRIDNALDAIEAALVVLREAGTLKAVRRGLINPQTQHVVPAVGIVPTDARRAGGPSGSYVWNVPVLLMVCTAGQQAKADQSITELMGEIEAAINTLEAAGTAGCTIDLPRWDFWYTPGAAGTLVKVGAWGMLDLRIDGPLKISE